MKETLFKEFPEVTRDQWKKQIESDLKGTDYEKLIFKSPDGVDVQPFYLSEDVKGAVQLPPPKQWNVCEKIHVDSAEKSNSKAKYALEKGAESLWFIVPSEEIKPGILLADIDLEGTPIFLGLQFLSEDYQQKLKEYLKSRKNQVYLQTDLIGNLARTGNWYFDQEKDHQVFQSILSNAEGFESVVSINASLYQNAGANIPQQLAYSLAHANEYLNFLDQNKIEAENFQPQFITSSGGNYFFEIAKVRTLRWLYSNLAKEYGFSGKANILAQPTMRDKTLYDYNVNLLRTTTESMSAILGGADSICNMPYDALFHNDNEFGTRIARNQLLVMKNEAYLNKVANPAEGAYYLENLTLGFAEAALELFKEIEGKGGFLQQLKSGEIQQQIRENAQKEQELFDNGNLILLGTNKFPNPEDKIAGDLEIDPFRKPTPEKTIVEPILEKRLSEHLEQERLEQEKTA